jgi:type I restriction enzyme S subunit
MNYRYEVALGKMLDEKRFTGENPAPYLRNVDVQWARINTNDLPKMDFLGEDLTRYALESGDLLVCEGGEVGRAAIWEGQLSNCYYQKALHRVRPRDLKCDTNQFLFFVFYAAATLGLFTGSEAKATIAHLTAETLRRNQFAFSLREEQEAIAEFLQIEIAKFDA